MALGEREGREGHLPSWHFVNLPLSLASSCDPAVPGCLSSQAATPRGLPQGHALADPRCPHPARALPHTSVARIGSGMQGGAVLAQVRQPATDSRGLSLPGSRLPPQVLQWGSVARAKTSGMAQPLGLRRCPPPHHERERLARPLPTAACRRSHPPRRPLAARDVACSPTVARRWAAWGLAAPLRCCCS